MQDPVLEAIAQQVFADELVDIHELEVVTNHPWFRDYCQSRGLDREAVEARLMVAHDDPVVDSTALRQLFPEDQDALLELLADLSAIDEHPDPRELDAIDALACSLGRATPNAEVRVAAARERTKPLRKRLNRPLPPPSRCVKLLSSCDRVFGRDRVDKVAAVIRQEHRIRCLRRRNYFNHKSYRNSLEQMQQLTTELLPQTLTVLEASSLELAQLQQGFTKITTGLVAGDLPLESRRQLQALLDNVRERLDCLIQVDIDCLRHDLQAKKRSLGHFCMAAVGRTKAGKSTLIATLTGRDQSAIGDGQQGFTRYNRAYNFYGMRLIDTPGIGAAGGEGETFEQAEIRDSDVARSIFPETDLVCFVMDNDSTVPCTREMMRDLHARGKAFLILLNVKAGMRGGLEVFRSRLDALFAQEGEQSISGNIAAIRRELSHAIGVQSAQRVQIIPIHAKAAFKAGDIKDQAEAEQWRCLSQVDHFLEKLDELITHQAPELRRQTLRKNPRLELERINTELQSLRQQLEDQAKIFRDTKISAEKQVREIFTDLQPIIRGRIAEIFGRLEVAAEIFSATHYRKNGQEIERLWRQEIERHDLPGQVEHLIDWLKGELAERLQELQEDIQERLKFQAQTFRFKNRLEFSFDIDFEEAVLKNIKLALKILAGALAIAGLFFGGIPLIIGAIVGFIPTLLDWILPGAEERRQKAQKELKQKLLETLKEPQQKLSEQLEQSLFAQREQVASAIGQALGGSQTALLAFANQVECCCSELERQAQFLT